VRKGDSLSAIADKFKVRVADIREWNNVDPSRHLKPGQNLTLFVDVTRVQ
jgi:membrane-bound lytic murein transglycosylase D